MVKFNLLVAGALWALMVSCESSPHRITGTVAGPWGQGVTVVLAGAVSASTTTDGEGHYAFDGLREGTYTITPTVGTSVFSPAGLIVHLHASDATGVDFASAPYVLRGVWGSGPSDVWAVGALGTILHWNGASWSNVPSGTAQHLNGIWGSASDDVWAVGEDGTSIHWDGVAWTSVPSGTTGSLDAVWGNAANDVWAVGFDTSPLHWNGAAWRPTARTDEPVWAVWGSSSSDVWTAGGVEVSHWDGLGWSSAVVTTYLRNLYGIWGSASDDVWIASGGNTGGFFHWDGHAWVNVNAPSKWCFAVWGSSPTDVWAVGDGILHWDGAAWSLESTDLRGLQAVWGSGPADVWAVGAFGAILHRDGSSWTQISP